jgi:anti-sigma regulatory factor (Ser/Thr protein kinase)
MGNPPPRQWHDAIPATLAAIDTYCLNVRNRISDTVNGPDLFAVLLLLREGLANAVLHGSENDAGKTVTCDLCIHADDLTLDIVDQGPGFDWRSVFAHPPDPDCSSGRGLQIYLLYADQIDYNACGNHITIVRRLHKGASHG